MACRRCVLGCIEFIEHALSWVFRYGLLLLQLVVIYLLALFKLGASVGAEDLFWSDIAWEQLLNGAGCGLLFAEVFLVCYLIERRRLGTARTAMPSVLPAALFDGVMQQLSFKQLAGYLTLFWLPSLLLLGIPKLIWHKPELSMLAFVPLQCGMLLAVAVFVGLVVLADRFDLFAAIRRMRLPCMRRCGSLHAIAVLSAGLFLASILVLCAFHEAGKALPPVFVVCMMLGLANSLYGALAYWAPGSQFVGLIAIVAGGLIVNSRTVMPDGDYKLTFPNLEHRYAAGMRVHIDEEQPEKQHGKKGPVDHYYELLKAQEKGDVAAPVLIPSEEPLRAMYERWRKAHPMDESKPRLLIIATSGGGIRAAVWTAVVLEGLDREVKVPLRDHIRMFTGASGGMVAAGLYVADFENRPAPLPDPDPQTGLGDLSGALARDSLKRTIQTMLLHDFPAQWWPQPLATDRGREIEKVWIANTASDKPSPMLRTFGDLQPMEREGRRPSLLFSPMLVEDARRLLVSNLDVRDLTWTFGDTAGFKPFGEIAGIKNIPDKPMLSLSAVELFRLFPETVGTFQVVTAARMNASFPLVSPGVSLPTSPPRRVVDAGYYDNHGVNLAALWMFRHEAALRQYTSGVALVEIRAYRNGYQRWHFQDKESEQMTPDPRMTDEASGGQKPRRSTDALTSALEWLSTPVEAIMSARDRAIYYRNDELLDGLSVHFNRKGGDFFTTLAFECDVDAALSWTLPASDAADVARAFYKDPKTRELQDWTKKRVKALESWYGNGGR